MKGKFIEKAKKDIMEILSEKDWELSINEIFELLDHRHGIGLIRSALSELSDKNLVVLRRGKSNLFTYSIS